MGVKALDSGMSDPEAKTEVDTPAVPPTDPPAPVAPSPAAATVVPPATPAVPIDENAAAAKKKRLAAALSAAGAKLMTALTVGNQVGLPRKSAALVVAHIALTDCRNINDLANYGATQAQEFCLRLRQRSPTAWMVLQDANAPAFVAILKALNLKVALLPLEKDARRGTEQAGDIDAYEAYAAILAS